MKDAASKGSARAVFFVAALGVSAAAATVAACIADLPPDQPPDAAAAVAPNCDDGFVDLDAGEQCDPGPSPGEGGALAGCTPQCQMECPSGFVWSGNNHCYRVASATAGTLATAETDRCGPLGAHVVTFASEAEFQAVVQHLGDGTFWVGLENSRPPYASVVQYEPGWAPTCAGCFAHTLDPTAALPRADADAAILEDCVEALTTPGERSWRQCGCTLAPPIRVICEREPVGVQSSQCEAGVCIDLVATLGSKRYVYVDQPATAEAAAQACQAMGGRLVVLGSRDEREQLWLQLSKLTVSPSPAAVWIGLATIAGDAGAAQWIWDDGTPADAPDAYPPPWGDKEPHVATATTTTRAYLEHFMTPPLDDTLARNDGTGMPLPFVCELTRAPAKM